MTTTDTPAPTMTMATGRHVTAGDVDLWTDCRGEGPDVVLLAGLSDPAEAWEFQLRALCGQYRLTAFDNRGAGRSPMPPVGWTVADMADDCAAILRATGVSQAHVMGFSGGSVNAQELALRHPDLVRSLVLVSTWARPDPYFDRATNFFGWLADIAPSERAMLEAFFLWIYTRRAHENGMVDQIIEEALAFPFPQPPEAFKAQLAAWKTHDAYDRLPRITAPTLVIAGDEDIATPPSMGRVVAERIPGAEFVVLSGEAHQPFQESPEEFNALVDAFWRKIDGR